VTVHARSVESGSRGGVSYPGGPPSLKNIKYAKVCRFEKKIQGFSFQGGETVSPGPPVALDGSGAGRCG